MPTAQAVTLAPSPVNPASALQSFSALEDVLEPVLELSGQFVHDAVPVIVLKVFITQAVNEPLPSGPVYPLFARQAVEPVAPPVAELSGQAVQAALPVAALKAFAAQAVNAPPSGPVYPAFAKQAVKAVEPIAPPVAELEGQPVHAVSPVTAL